ncbi:TIGR01777 family oxidoreductase [Flavobacterium pallidum]|uniref:TIGR01777 family protein n=1 Tax=Flavobacterium pallidum TaxID=2172098 RepID=A0A2S1SLK8_9FLAO|nr:TIGR01777 family oxidoreductase [Flavobacterium pallidum]AWI27242.1 TIGR01777 family protein [Flavobacterium pallidum]
MKILITGATGLIGSELVSTLLKHGHHIHYLSTSNEKLASEPHYRGFYWNPEKGKIDDRAIEGIETIIHLAGASISKRWTKKYKQEIIESRVLSANLLFSTLKNHPHQVKHLISASAIGIYPDRLKNIYTEETKEVDEGFLGYVVEKWEQVADKFRLLNIKVAKIRTGIVLSDKGGALMEMVKPVKFGLGSPFGSGKQYQSWIHISDLVGIYRMAAEQEWTGAFNAVAPHAVTNKELMRTIADTLHKPFFMPNIPEFLMQLVLGEMHTILFSSQNVSSTKVRDNGYQFQYDYLEKALHALLVHA